MIYWKTSFLAATFSIANCTRGCRGTPVGNHYLRSSTEIKDYYILLKNKWQCDLFWN